jgi:mono/diheme cytochrome c family protein
MKNKISTLFIFSLVAIMASFLLSSYMNSTPQADDWEVPSKYKHMENPTDPSDSEGLAIGKSLYNKHCKSCHGKTGEGDGPKAEELDTPCGDFTTEEFHAQSDGELFYKTTFGRDDMPKFSSKISDDEDRWLLVNYMRTFQ